MRKLICTVIALFLCTYSVHAQADTIYIQIPIEVQEKYTSAGFIDDYLKTTGEIFVLGNMMEEKNEDQMTGSSRITWEQCNTELKTRWSMINCYKQIDKELPPQWIEKIETIE